MPLQEWPRRSGTDDVDLMHANTIAMPTERVLDQDDLVADEDESFDVLDVLKTTISKEEELAKLEAEARAGDARGDGGDEGGPETSGYGSDRDEDVVTFGGQATFSMHSRKAAKKARRPKYERTRDAVVQTGALTRAGTADDMRASGSADFAGLGVSALLCGHLEKQGYENPTTVQARAIPPLLQGKDVLVESATGSGKTLSYLVPVFDALAKRQPKVRRGDGTLALILCPTRELCLQVLDIATIISRRFTWIVPGSIHGGENRAKEKSRLRKGVNVLICTPGRLYDHLTKTAAFDVRGVSWVVLDEADRLLDLGFKKQISGILDVVRERASSKGQVQTVLLSATLSGVQGLLEVVRLRDPITVRGREDGHGVGAAAAMIGTIGTIGTTETVQASQRQFYDDIPEKLVQEYVVVPCKFRLISLMAALKDHFRAGSASQPRKVLVFLSNCDSVDFHQVFLESHWDTGEGQAWKDQRDGSKRPEPVPQPAVIKLHGNMTQIERTRSLLSFTKEKRGILLATDVASRGLDFPEVSMIIQYDAPMGPEEYVHRVGRTARFGRHGSALLFVSPAECGFIGYLHAQCGITALSKRDGVELLNNGYGPDKKAGKSLALELHRGANVVSQAIKSALAKDAELTKLAEMAFTSSVRSYCTHSRELKEFFRVGQLHLGHFANAFGLKENPKAAAGKGKKGRNTKEKRGNVEKRSRLAFGGDQFNAKGPAASRKKKKAAAYAGFHVSS